MYEQGKSFAEIQQITGRSRGAQAKVLGAVGLNEREVDMQAWKMAKLEYRRKAISEGRPDVEWENPTKVDLAPYYPEARERCLAAARTYYEYITGGKDNTPNIPSPESFASTQEKQSVLYTLENILTPIIAISGEAAKKNMEKALRILSTTPVISRKKA